MAGHHRAHAHPPAQERQVEVLSGKDAGKKGKVLQVIPEKNRVLVQGVNFIKRHTRPNPQRQIKGGIAEREAPIHASNLNGRVRRVRQEDAHRQHAAGGWPQGAGLSQVQRSLGPVMRPMRDASRTRHTASRREG